MLVHADNFNIYGTGPSSANMTNGVYAEVTGGVTIVNDPDGVSIPKCVALSGDVLYRYVLATANNVVGVSMRLWLQNLPANNSQVPHFITFSDGSNVGIVRCRVNTTGSIGVDRFNTGTSLWEAVGDTTGPVITANAWWHIEVKYTGGTTSDGRIEIRVEGVEKFDTATIDMQTLNVSQISFGASVDNTSAGPINYHKDLVIWDDQGSNNTDFLGGVLVAQLDPDADTTIGGWVPSTGSVAWSILDTATPGDTPYVAADNTPPAAMVMTMTDLPPDITTVKGVFTVVRAKKADGGDGQLQNSLISNAVESNGADRPITTAQTYWYDLHEVDPDTGVAWTPAAVDDVEIKIDRTL